MLTSEVCVCVCVGQDGVPVGGRGSEGQGVAYSRYNGKSTRWEVRVLHSHFGSYTNLQVTPVPWAPAASFT